MSKNGLVCLNEVEGEGQGGHGAHVDPHGTMAAAMVVKIANGPHKLVYVNVKLSLSEWHVSPLYLISTHTKLVYGTHVQKLVYANWFIEGS